MQAANRVAKNTGILYAKMALTVFISLYTTRLILGALGAEDFGIFNVVGGAIAMLGFLNSSMTAASQRFMSHAQGARDLARLKKIFNVSIILHLFIAVMLVIALEVAGYFFFNGILTIPDGRMEAAKMIYHVMVISAVFNVVGVPYDAVINSHENMLFFALLGTLESVLKLSIAFYITYFGGDDLITYGILMASMSLLVFIVRAFYCSRKYNECEIKPKTYFEKPIFREMSSFAGWSFLGSSTGMVAKYGQGIVLNAFFGTVVNAAQGITNQLSGQLGVFSNTMLRALNPVIAKSEGAGERNRMVNASITGSKLSFFLLMLMFIPVLIEAPLILKIWLKEVPPFTIIFLRLYLIENMLNPFFVTLNSSIAAVGNIKKLQIFTSAFNLLPLVVTYLLFKYGFPPQSMYAAFIGYATLKFCFSLYFSNKTFGLSPAFFIRKVCLKCIPAFGLVFGIAALPAIFMAEGVWRMAIVILLNLGSFAAVVWFYGLSNQERSLIVNLKLQIAKRLKKVLKRYQYKAA